MRPMRGGAKERRDHAIVSSPARVEEGSEPAHDAEHGLKHLTLAQLRVQDRSSTPNRRRSSSASSWVDIFSDSKKSTTTYPTMLMWMALGLVLLSGAALRHFQFTGQDAQA
ncbi:unnamed protein product [Chrysoparadoxa australica]